MVATIGAAECIKNARAGRGTDATHIMVSSADFDALMAAGHIKSETFRKPSDGPGVLTTEHRLEGQIVAVMGEPISAMTFGSKTLTAERAREDARGNETVNAISSVDAIMFAIQIEDHFDRLQWLMDWRDGEWGEMRRSYPAFDLNEWRTRI